MARPPYIVFHWPRPTPSHETAATGPRRQRGGSFILVSIGVGRTRRMKRSAVGSRPQRAGSFVLLDVWGGLNCRRIGRRMAVGTAMIRPPRISSTPGHGQAGWFIQTPPSGIRRYP